MRRLLSTSFIILALVIGTAGAAPAVHAASGVYCPSNTSSSGTYCTSSQVCDYEQGVCVDSSNASSVTSQSTAGTQSPIQNPTGDAAAQFGPIMSWIMSLFAWLVGVAALTLDYAVYYTVVMMGSYVHNLTAIGVTWQILRDVGNIMLIFGFLAVGITTILNVNWYGGGYRMLPMMLAAAVFLNFSLFISEAIIDTGNLFATQFFTQINGGTLPTPTGTGITGLASNGVNLTTGNEGISNRIMGQLGLQNIYGAALTNTKILEGGYSWIVGFMGIILFIVAAFVMFSLAFVLIARFIALVFLLVVAPVGFAGLAIPGFAARAKDWWTQLFHQTITAPILLLMLYIALAVITDVKFLTGFGVTGGSSAATGFWDGFVQNTTGASNLAGFASMLLSFLVAMGLLIAVVVYAKRWSAFGGDWATKTAAKLSFGLTAAGMRTTVGWGSQRLSQAWRHTPLSRAPILGRAVSGALDRGAKGSFDLRGTGALKAIPFGSNIAAGTAQKGGFRDWEKGKIKEREEYAKTLEQTSGTILGHKFFEGEKEDQEIAEGRLRVSKAAYEAEKTEDNKRVMEEAKDEVERLKRAPQAGYAKGLRLGLDKGNFINRVINPQRNTKAADNIIKEATKSKIDKDFDSLKKLLEEKAKEKETEEKKSEAPKP